MASVPRLWRPEGCGSAVAAQDVDDVRLEGGDRSCTRCQGRSPQAGTGGSPSISRTAPSRWTRSRPPRVSSMVPSGPSTRTKVSGKGSGTVRE